MVRNFEEFCQTLLNSGFSMGGGNSKGIYAVVPYDWKEQQIMDVPARWHTGDPDTDPWEWRMRVLEERQDIAYGKVFFRTSGYITRDWYPDFLAVRRGGLTLEEAYEEGTVSRAARNIYRVLVENGETPLHELKQLGGFTREQNSAFDRGLLELQMGLYVTMCGRQQKVNQFGEGYGWSSTVFTTTEKFWESRNVELPERDPEEAYDRILAQIFRLNPEANRKQAEKFIRG